MNKMIKIICLLLMALIITLAINTSYAVDDVMDKLEDDIDKAEVDGEESTNLTVKIINLIQYVAIIGGAILIAVLGLKYITGSVEERADYKKSFVPLCVGAVVVMSATSISSLIFLTLQGTENGSSAKTSAEKTAQSYIERIGGSHDVISWNLWSGALNDFEPEVLEYLKEYCIGGEHGELIAQPAYILDGEAMNEFESLLSELENKENLSFSEKGTLKYLQKAKEGYIEGETAAIKIIEKGDEAVNSRIEWLDKLIEPSFAEQVERAYLRIKRDGDLPAML